MHFYSGGHFYYYQEFRKPMFYFTVVDIYIYSGGHYLRNRH